MTAIACIPPMEAIPPLASHLTDARPGRVHIRLASVLSTLETDTSPDVTRVAAALNLTETEARLALTIAVGKTIKEFAKAQGCTWHTARTHARNLLLKTGCHRQVEVGLLVRSLA
ncbi:helix-turn-helix transcriptional regulator [Ottowia sp. VDI28]|uniref:helix-turn-helix transcriptional regulator n=1 Tax=Ottowia sp. VDI28 TaxID=3133968 RepID=UPI003C2DB831